MVLARDETEVRVARLPGRERWPDAVRVCVGDRARIVPYAHRDALVDARAPLLPIEVGKVEVRDQVQHTVDARTRGRHQRERRAAPRLRSARECESEAA